MSQRRFVRVCGAAIASLLVAACIQTVEGQSLHSVIEPRARVFPTVGPGITALKRDSSGHYYILARPATIVSIYGPEGNLVGQIPNANSQGAKITYAVDIDLSPDGRLFVADRGANAIEIFNPDGSLVSRIPVLAPTSVVALSDGQFAVTTLASRRLVEILDNQGKMVRDFGDPANVENLPGQDVEKKSPVDWGKIVGSPAGDIYFAFTALRDPLLRKYDRYGYVGYEASVPESFFALGQPTPRDRVEMTFDVTHLSFADETTGWFSLGSSGDVKFGGGMGAGLSRAFSSGGNFAPAGMSWSGGQPAIGNLPGGAAGGTLGGTFSGQITNQGTQFQFWAGSIASGRRGARGRNLGSTALDQEPLQGNTLQFFGSGSDDTDQYTSQVLAFAGTDSLSPDALSTASYGGTNVSQYSGLPAAFADPAIFLPITFQPQAPPGGMLGRFLGVGPRFGSGTRGPYAGAHFGTAHFGSYGHFRAGEADLGATVRVNLGDLGRNSREKPVITATGVDPFTHDLWAGVGDTLIHFNQEGAPVEVFYLVMKGGVPLKPSALLVEPHRILIAADPWGIFEFARP